MPNFGHLGIYVLSINDFEILATKFQPLYMELCIIFPVSCFSDILEFGLSIGLTKLSNTRLGNATKSGPF